MPAAKLRASTILRAFHEAEAELVGKTVVLSDGKADGGNCLARRGPRLKNCHRRPCRELAYFNNQIRAKLGWASWQILSHGRPIPGADHAFLIA
jgi:hypothetical protein